MPQNFHFDELGFIHVLWPPQRNWDRNTVPLKSQIYSIHTEWRYFRLLWTTQVQILISDPCEDHLRLPDLFHFLSLAHD